ncbi:hypothetical protein BH11ARM2_BH11ARM2_23290 [soil metagenome]
MARKEGILSITPQERLFLNVSGLSAELRGVVTNVSPTLDEPATILLVEDTPDDEELALRALRRLRASLVVKVARDGLAALHALGLDGAQGKRRPDIVLCDLKLPKVGGDEVLRQTRAKADLRGIPFVVFSSSDEPSDVARCDALGASEYAVKPIDYEEYSERVGQIVERHLASAQALQKRIPPALLPTED